MSTVNACEVASKYTAAGSPPELVWRSMTTLRLDIVAFDEERAYLVAALRPTTRHLGLSLGDRACLALGLRLGAPVFTADRSWAGLKVDTAIHLIR